MQLLPCSLFSMVWFTTSNQNVLWESKRTQITQHLAGLYPPVKAGASLARYLEMPTAWCFLLVWIHPKQTETDTLQKQCRQDALSILTRSVVEPDELGALHLWVASGEFVLMSHQDEPTSRVFNFCNFAFCVPGCSLCNLLFPSSNLACSTSKQARNGDTSWKRSFSQTYGIKAGPIHSLKHPSLCPEQVRSLCWEPETRPNSHVLLTCTFPYTGPVEFICNAGE